MKQVFWLIKDQLCGRPGPNHEPWQASELKAGGVDTVVSLNNAESVYPADFLANGMAYRCIPLSTNAPPREGDLELCQRQLLTAYQFVRDEIASGNTVLVHCRHGKDRTGLFMAYFLRNHLDMDTAEAISRVKAVRPIALTAAGWDQLAFEILESCPDAGTTR